MASTSSSFRDVTQERTARQALLKQQATLAFVQETARVATWEMDLVNRTIQFGADSWPVYGRPCSEISTIDELDKIIRPADLPHVVEDAQRAIRTGTMSIVDYQVTTPEGVAIWVECRRVPVYNESGVVTHLRGMTTDITARKQNAEELAASEARYRVLADLNPQAIWMGAPNGQITYANQGFLDYIGLRLEDATTGLKWLDAFYEEDRTRVIESWNHSVTTGSEYDIEARMVRASDGAVRWWWLRALPVRDDTGNILNWLGVATEIHDRRTHAEQLQTKQLETERQRAELESIYQSAPVGLALFEPTEFRYLRVNDRQAETMGLPREQIVGRRIADLVPLKGLIPLLRLAAEAASPIRNYLCSRAKTPRTPRRAPVSWNVSFPRRSATTRSALSRPSPRSCRRSRTSRNPKLRLSSRRSSPLSAGLHPPSRTRSTTRSKPSPTSSISSNAKPRSPTRSSRSSTWLSPSSRASARSPRRRSASIAGPSPALLTTGHCAAPRRSSPRSLYARVACSVHHRHHTVEATYASSTAILCSTENGHVRQVLNNLIANAIDAMRQHGGRLLVRAHDTVLYYPDSIDGTSFEPVRAVRITIADTGHGMPPEVRARIFEPFYTTKDLNGTGLGLWIYNGIVARHKGRLTLRTAVHPVHHGTIFSLTLPTEQEPTHLIP